MTEISCFATFEALAGQIGMKRFYLLFLTLLATTWSAHADLESDVRSVLPTRPEQRWAAIPWVVDLQQARRESQETGKPIFAWVMDGHVLAAT